MDCSNNVCHSDLSETWAGLFLWRACIMSRFNSTGSYYIYWKLKSGVLSLDSSHFWLCSLLYIFLFMKMRMPLISLILHTFFCSHISNRVGRRKRRKRRGSTMKWLRTRSSRTCRAGATWSTGLASRKQVQVTTMLHLRQDLEPTHFLCQINPWTQSTFAWWKLRISYIRWTGTSVGNLTCPSKKVINNYFCRIGPFVTWSSFWSLSRSGWSNVKIGPYWNICMDFVTWLNRFDRKCVSLDALDLSLSTWMGRITCPGGYRRAYFFLTR